MAISLIGLGSEAALATVVGVLEEVPIMLSLVAFANRMKHWFPNPDIPTSERGHVRSATLLPEHIRSQLGEVALPPP